MSSQPNKRTKADYLISDSVPTKIEQNSFAFLGLSTRDSKHKIIETAEEKSLSEDESLCFKAKSDLTSPRSRLACEMAWLPGVSPKKAKELLVQLRDDPQGLLSADSVEPLAHANLMASVLELLDETLNDSEWEAWIQALSKVSDNIDPESVLQHVNEDRVVSGFPEIRSTDQIEKELASRTSYYNLAIKGALDQLPANRLLAVITNVVDVTTDYGEEHATVLIDDLIDKYHVETQGTLEAGAEKIYKLIEGASNAAHKGEKELSPIIDAIEKYVTEWDAIAQPIQVNFKSRGIHHDLSVLVGVKIRDLAIELTNEHGMLEVSQRIMEVLKEVFAELPELVDRLDDDTEALEDLFSSRDDLEKDQENFGQEITYEADVGLVFKNKLRISPDGLQWGDKIYPLDKITRVRWGAVRHSVNGIPTGTEYTIAFGDDHSWREAKTKRKDVYSSFLDRLWRAVCVNLMVSTLEILRDGEKLTFGEATVDDNGIVLKKRKFLKSEPVYHTWDLVTFKYYDGNLVINSKRVKKCYCSVSLKDVDNAHILDSCIRSAFKNGYTRLSRLLE